MRRRTIIVAAIAAGLAMASLALPARRPLVWNVTHSVPTGLYWIGDKDALAVGERVSIEPPAVVRQLLAERGYPGHRRRSSQPAQMPWRKRQVLPLARWHPIRCQLHPARSARSSRPSREAGRSERCIAPFSFHGVQWRRIVRFAGVEGRRSGRMAR